jgi:alpha-galactosidase
MRDIAVRAGISVTMVALVALCVSVRVSIAQSDRFTADECPRINGAAIYGARPNHPFLYRIPSTGARPMTFSAVGLPDGLTLDPKTGIITGAPKGASSHVVGVLVTNAAGSATRRLQIIIGDKIALTPPMGWSSWSYLQTDVSDKDVRAQANALITSGLAGHGYSYINIDDGWEEQGVGPRHTDAPPRSPDGSVRPNDRFPDMTALTSYLHAKGLKAGIYTTPGPPTCGRFEGSWA